MPKLSSPLFYPLLILMIVKIIIIAIITPTIPRIKGDSSKTKGEAIISSKNIGVPPYNKLF